MSTYRIQGIFASKTTLNWMIASYLPEASTNSFADQNWTLAWEDTPDPYMSLRRTR
jgi:hypothetical protein